MEEELSHTFEALPKSGRGLDARVAEPGLSHFLAFQVSGCEETTWVLPWQIMLCTGRRDVTRPTHVVPSPQLRLFLQVHSWQMKVKGCEGSFLFLSALGLPSTSQGLQPVAGAWHEHSPTIALKRAPAKLNWAQLGRVAALAGTQRVPRRNVFDKKLQQRGLNLNAPRRPLHVQRSSLWRNLTERLSQELSVLAATIEELVRNEADVLLNASCRARKPSQNATESKCCQSRSRGPCREVSYQAAGFSGQGGQGLEASAAQEAPLGCDKPGNRAKPPSFRFREVMEYYMSSSSALRQGGVPFVFSSAWPGRRLHPGNRVFGGADRSSL